MVRVGTGNCHHHCDREDGTVIVIQQTMMLLKTPVYRQGLTTGCIDSA